MGNAWRFVVFALVSYALAQNDGLGPHNIDGRGCLACHTPSAGTVQMTEAGSASEAMPLWTRQPAFEASAEGEIHAPRTFVDWRHPLFHTTVCLACHDGAIAVAGMIGKPHEMTGVAKVIDPELSRTTTTHPVHVPYLPNNGCAEETETCNPSHWPSTVDSVGHLGWTMNEFAAKFTETYGRSVRFFPSSENGGHAMVECSTCHNPHSLQYAQGKFANVSNSVKPTRSFVRSWYDPGDRSTDTRSRFCRSCHFSMSPESVGLMQ
jgi:hypothetical protein